MFKEIKPIIRIDYLHLSPIILYYCCSQRYFIVILEEADANIEAQEITSTIKDALSFEPET